MQLSLTQLLLAVELAFPLMLALRFVLINLWVAWRLWAFASRKPGWDG